MSGLITAISDPVSNSPDIFLSATLPRQSQQLVVLLNEVERIEIHFITRKFIKCALAYLRPDFIELAR